MKPFEMQSIPPRAMDAAQIASQQLMRADLANEHAARMTQQSAQQQIQQVTEADTVEFLGVHERQGGGEQKEKQKGREQEERRESKGPKLPNVGYAEEKILDIKI